MSAEGVALKGRELMFRFEEGWFRGRILKQANDRSVKSSGHVCNYRVFYEADDELLNQPLYPNSYSPHSTARTGAWVLLAVPRVALEGPQPQMLALMPPTRAPGDESPSGHMDALD